MTRRTTNWNAPFLRWNSCCVTVTLRQRKGKHFHQQTETF